jgi:uncharacterized protein
MNQSLDAKRSELSSILGDSERIVVAYSGGVDSSFLAAIAHEVLGRDAVAATAASPSIATSELRAAKDLATRRGWNHLVVTTREVEREEYARNSPDRCYWCKTELFDVLEPVAEKMSAQIAVGTNVDDLGDYRPGIAAAQERRVRAPLVEARLTKAEIRSLSDRMGLPTARKLAAPCLASRFAYGVRVTPAGLRRVDAAEEFLRSLGFSELRVRDHGDLARIEVPTEDSERVVSLRDEIARALSDLGFTYITLDLSGFKSGSLNAVVAPTIGRRGS